jgi:hypothetical protein
VATALRGSAVFLALALVMVVAVMWRPARALEQQAALELERSLVFED